MTNKLLLILQFIAYQTIAQNIPWVKKSISQERGGIYPFSDGLARSLNSGYFDKNGEVVLTLDKKYQQVDDFHEGFARVQHKSNSTFVQGVINKNGHELITANRVGFFSEGLIAVENNKQHYFIDAQGNPKFILPINTYFFKGSGFGSYMDLDFSFFSEGLISVYNSNSNKYGFIDKNGTIKIPFLFDFAGQFKNGLCRITQNRKHGFINKEGKIVIPTVYDFVNDFSDGVAIVRKNENDILSVIDKNGKQIIPPIYEYEGDFSSGLAVVKNTNLKKYGFIDKQGKLVIPYIYDYADNAFSEGLIAVVQNEKFGFIDTTGKVIIPFVFDFAENFTNNLSIVKIGETYGIIKNPLK